MKIEVLGCSGGMGQGEFTTCLRINDQLLIDAGSGLGNLTQQQMLAIKSVFITHAHLDHICFLPMLLDNLFEQLSMPIEVFALPEVLQALKTHVFNWHIWPDFTQLPSSESAVLNFNPIQQGESKTLHDLQIAPIKAQHVVPACGYSVIDAQGRVFCFSGDTLFDQGVSDAYNQIGPIQVLMLECAFPNRLDEIARKSHHLTPKSLSMFIASLNLLPEELWITHLKPSLHDEIVDELQQLNLPLKLVFLKSGQTFFL